MPLTTGMNEQPRARWVVGWRAGAFRGAAFLFALVWLTFGFGLIDLLAITGAAWDPPPVDASTDVGLLSIAYGSVATFLIAGAFGAMAVSPALSSVATLQVAALVIAFAAAGGVGLDPLSFISVAMLLIMMMILRVVHPRPRPRLWPKVGPLHRSVLAVALVGAPAALLYAHVMLAHSRQRLVPEEMALRPQAGGWAGASILAVAAVLLTLLAATRVPGRRLPAWTTFLAVAPWAWTSAAQPSLPGSPGRVWAFLAAAWALAVVSTVEASSRPHPPT